MGAAFISWNGNGTTPAEMFSSETDIYYGLVYFPLIIIKTVYKTDKTDSDLSNLGY